jgi:hypothetical protein
VAISTPAISVARGDVEVGEAHGQAHRAAAGHREVVDVVGGEVEGERLVGGEVGVQARPAGGEHGGEDRRGGVVGRGGDEGRYRGRRDRGAIEEVAQIAAGGLVAGPRAQRGGEAPAQAQAGDPAGARSSVRGGSRGDRRW